MGGLKDNSNYIEGDCMDNKEFAYWNGVTDGKMKTQKKLIKWLEEEIDTQEEIGSLESAEALRKVLNFVRKS